MDFNEVNQKTILVVDDDEATRATYVELFRNNGFNVLEAKDGVEGLDVATSQNGIELIFTGIIMPRMDGFQLMSALKENAVTAKIPVIMNSHLGREEDRIKAMDMGAKDFIIRGLVSPSEVIKRVLMCFSGHKKFLLKIDPYSFDGQEMISNLSLPSDFLCTNCGEELGLQISTHQENSLTSKILCPNCKKIYF